MVTTPPKRPNSASASIPKPLRITAVRTLSGEAAVSTF